MKNAYASKPDTAGLLNLGQINHAIKPLRIDAQGLAAYGFKPAAPSNPRSQQREHQAQHHAESRESF